MARPKIDPKDLQPFVNQLRLKQEATRVLAEEEAEDQFTVPESLSLASLLALDIPPMEWTIEGLHAAGMNTMLVAQFKTGKTTLNTNLIRSLVDGVDFLGHAVRPPEGRVAFWNYEMGDRMMQQWLEDVKIEHPESVEILNLRGRRIPLYSPHVQQWAIEWLATNEITSWIIDPAIKAMSGWPGEGNENDNGKVSDFLDVLDNIKSDADVTDLFLSHHTGRAAMEEGEERGRGATRWDDWPDVRWILTKKKNKFGMYDRFFYADGRDVVVKESKIIYDEKTRWLTVDENVSRKSNTELQQALAVVDALVKIGDNHNKTKVKANMTGVDGKLRFEAIERAAKLGLITLMNAAKGTGILVRLEREHPTVAAHLAATAPISLVEGWDKS